VTLEGLNDALAGNIDQFSTTVIRAAQQFAIIFNERQISHQLVVRSQVQKSFLIVDFVNDMNLPTVIANSCKIPLSLLSRRQGSDKDITKCLLIYSLFRGNIVVTYPTVITGCDDVLVDTLQFPVLHHLAFDGTDLF
jgi:hypothetical protein